MPSSKALGRSFIGSSTLMNGLHQALFLISVSTCIIFTHTYNRGDDMSYSFTDPDFVPQRCAKDSEVMDIFAGCGGLSYGLEMVRRQHFMHDAQECLCP